MSHTKYPLTLFFCFLSLLVFSQTKDSTIFMKWKLKPNEILSYKTVMQEIDTANHIDFSMDGMMKAIGINKKEDFDEARAIFKKLNAQMQNANFVTHLRRNKKGAIDIELAIVKDSTITNKKTSDTDKFSNIQKMMASMNSGIMLRGSIHEDGTIESFYTKNDQKNLVAIMFELPGKSVKPGDSWPLNTNLLSMDQNFVCDSSYKKNVVSFIGIENRNGERIVNLKYDLVEYVNGAFLNSNMSMKMTYQGIAQFSIEKGRWITYEGIMGLSSTGMMSSQSTKKISLTSE